MAIDANINRIKFLRTKTAGSVPSASLLDEGELAINLVDRTIYSKNGSSVVELGFGKGGNVSGAISAPQFNGPLVGNASTATKLQTTRTISLAGSATGSISFDGTSDQTISVNVNKLDALATYTKSNSDSPTQWAQGIQSSFVSSTQGWPMSYGGVITARPYLNGGGALQIMTAYGSDSGVGGGEIKIRTGDYNGLNNDAWTSWKTLVHSENVNNYSPTKTGVGASGDWGISITGNSATATKLQTPRTISLIGDGVGSASFDGSANASINLTLNDVNNSAGTYGANHLEIPTFTLNKKGLLTSAGNRAFPYAGVGQYGAAILYDGIDSYSTSHAVTANAVRFLGERRYIRSQSSGQSFDTARRDFDGVHTEYRWLNAPTDNIAAVQFYNYSNDWNGKIFFDIVNHKLYTQTFTNGTTHSAWNEIAYTNALTRYRQDLDATRIYSPNLQRALGVTDSGVDVSDLRVSGSLYGSKYKSNSRVWITDHTEHNAQGMDVGSLFVGPAFSEDILTPTNGIYAKGIIRSDAGFQGKLLAKDSRIFKPFNAETGGISTYFVTEVGLNNDYVGGNYGDFLSLNTYHDASAGMQNGLYFDKTGKRITHYQSAFGATNWGSGKTLAYSEDVLSTNGGTMNAPINFNLSHADGAFHKLIEGNTSTDGGYIAVGNHGSDKGYLELGTTDDENAAIYARKRTSANAILKEAVILGPDGNTSFPGTVIAPAFNGALSGNATSATKLQTARTISLTGAVTGSVSFDGNDNASISTSISGVVGITNGGTGATTAATARTNLDVYSKAEVDSRSTSAVDFIPYLPLAYPKSTPPSGYLVLMGQAISQATYPILYALYGATLPDLRGRFLRGLDYGRGIDAGRIVLSEQGDAIRNITASAPTGAEYFNANQSLAQGAFTIYSGAASRNGSLSTQNAEIISFNASRVVPTADENRPKNIAFLYIVKAG